MHCEPPALPRSQAAKPLLTVSRCRVAGEFIYEHAGATAVTISARRLNSELLVEVSDNGVGGADPEGSGLRGLADRVAALDGRLRVDSPAGAGTRITAELPCAW
jgi:glucose-6-phosphate-specific signal transduction histidine kinase